MLMQAKNLGVWVAFITLIMVATGAAAPLPSVPLDILRPLQQRDADIILTPLAAQFSALPPQGCLGAVAQLDDAITSAGGLRAYVMHLDAAQMLDVAVQPNAGLGIAVTLIGPGDMMHTSASSVPGDAALLSAVPVDQAGTYILVIMGMHTATGTFELAVGLNSALEQEPYLASNNNTPAQAQQLNAVASQVSAGAQVMSVAGSMPDGTPDPDWYSIYLQSGEYCSFAVSGREKNMVKAGLYDTDGTHLLTTSEPSGTPFTETVLDFKAPQAGTYRLFVMGSGPYTLSAFRNISLEAEHNDQPAQAQDITSTGRALSHIGSSGLNRLFLYRTLGFGRDIIEEIDPVDGTVLNTLPSPLPGGPGPHGYMHGMATTDDSLLVGGVNATDIYELDPDTGAILRTFDGPFVHIRSLAFHDGSIYVTEEQCTGFKVVDYLTGEIDLIPDNLSGWAGQVAALCCYNKQLLSASGNAIYVWDLSIPEKTFFGSCSNEYWLGAVKGAGAMNGHLFTCRSHRLYRYSMDDLACSPFLETTNAHAIGADFPGIDEDCFRFAVNAGDVITLQTDTPFDGPLALENTLDPAVMLYDPNGQPIATDLDSAPDGRNARLTWTASQSGYYTARIYPESATQGTCLLTVSGNTAPSAPLRVVSTDPADGALLPTAPNEITVTFNQPVRLTSLQASALQVDGTAARRWRLQNAQTVTFILPELAEGAHAISMDAEALTGISGRPLEAFSAAFTIDLTPPRVIGSTLYTGNSTNPGALSLQIDFSEPIATGQVDVADIVLAHPDHSEHVTPISYAFNEDGTRLQLEYMGLREHRWSFSLISSNQSFQDRAGHALDGEPNAVLPSGDGTAGGDFCFTFRVDVETLALDPFIHPEIPLGAGISRADYTAQISPADDTDQYTLDLDAGQLLTVVVDPASNGMPHLTITGPAGSTLLDAVATHAGQAAFGSIRITGAGRYTLTVNTHNGSEDTYALQVLLNAGVEMETYTGSLNNHASVAESLNGLLLNLPGDAQHGAVIGALTDWPDWYSVYLQQGQHLSLYAAAEDAESVIMELFANDGILLATGTCASVNTAAAIEQFAAPSDGTYLVRLSGLAESYTLAATLDAQMDIETTDTPSSAQALDGNGIVMGAVGDQGPGRLFAYDRQAHDIIELDPDTGAIINRFASPLPHQPGPHGWQFGMATTHDSLLMAAHTTHPIYEMDLDTGQVIRWLPHPPWHVDGMAFRNGRIYMKSDQHDYRIMVMDYHTGTMLQPLLCSTPPYLSGALGASCRDLYGMADDHLLDINPRNGIIHLQATLPTAGYGQGMGVIRDTLFLSAGYWDGEYRTDIEAYNPRTLEKKYAFTTNTVISAIGGDGGGDMADFYRISALAHDVLTIETMTPYDAPDQPENYLDPVIELFSPDGSLVAADDNSAADGRNALLSHRTVSAGTFIIRITATNRTCGSYILRINGGAGQPPLQQVCSTWPENGSSITFAPDHVIIDFTAAMDPVTVQAADLAMDGIAADRIQWINAHTLRFNCGTLAEGTHTAVLQAGCMHDVHGRPLQQQTFSFTVDLTPPRVTASSIMQDDTLPTGPLTWTLCFSEDMIIADGQPIPPEAVSLQGMYYGNRTVDHIGYNATTRVLTVCCSNIPEDGYTLAIEEDNCPFTDRAGHALDGEPNWPLLPSGNGTPGGHFSVGFMVDTEVMDITDTLQPVITNGALQFQTALNSLIQPQTDMDGYRLDLDAGQLLTVRMQPAAMLQGFLFLAGPDGAVRSVMAPAAGHEAILQSVPVDTRGSYLILAGGTGLGVGTYHLQILLESAYNLAQGTEKDTWRTIDAAFSRDNGLGIVFNCTPQTRGLRYIPEVATSLSGPWYSGNLYIREISELDENGQRIMRAFSLIPVHKAPQQFMRLKIVSP
jgi:methionine-rich copper-binding protein CopC